MRYGLPVILLLGVMGCYHKPKTILYDSASFRAAVAARVGELPDFRVSVSIPGQDAEWVIDRAALLRPPFELDPAAAAKMEPCIFTSGDERTRYNRLRTCLLGGDKPFRYVSGSTLDAVTCYRLHQGNCFSLTNLFVGAARLARLPAYYMLVEDIIGNQSEGSLVIHTNHIVAVVPVDRDRMIVDFIPNPRDYRYTTVLSDLEATGLFYNNLAARLLLEGKDRDAARLFRIARLLYPDSYQIYNNIGVMALRSGRFQAAQACFARAMETARFPDLILGNVLMAYERTGNRKAFQRVQRELEHARKRNPFLYIMLARKAIRQGKDREALDLLKTARRINRRIPDIYILQVRIYGRLKEPGKQARAYRNLLRYGHREPVVTVATP